MLIFPLEQVPEMARGAGVRLQRYKDGGLSDVKTFKGAEGLTWTDGAGRTFSLTLKELADWRGNRADAGRLRAEGIPAQQQVQVGPATTDRAARSSAAMTIVSRSIARSSSSRCARALETCDLIRGRDPNRHAVGHRRERPTRIASGSL